MKGQRRNRSRATNPGIKRVRYHQEWCSGIACSFLGGAVEEAGASEVPFFPFRWGMFRCRLIL
jgi:hypothetical protein